MSVLPRAQGTPEPAAAAIIEQIRAYALAEPDEDPDDNAVRLISLHHIYDAARDYLDAGMAALNRPGPGPLSIRVQADVLGLANETVMKRIRHGRDLLKRRTTRRA